MPAPEVIKIENVEIQVREDKHIVLVYDKEKHVAILEKIVYFKSDSLPREKPDSLSDNVWAKLNELRAPLDTSKAFSEEQRQSQDSLRPTVPTGPAEPAATGEGSIKDNDVAGQTQKVADQKKADDLPL